MLFEILVYETFRMKYMFIILWLHVWTISQILSLPFGLMIRCHKNWEVESNFQCAQSLSIPSVPLLDLEAERLHSRIELIGCWKDNQRSFETSLNILRKSDHRVSTEPYRTLTNLNRRESIETSISDEQMIGIWVCYLHLTMNGRSDLINERRENYVPQQNLIVEVS